jgi:beta-glucuronidase
LGTDLFFSLDTPNIEIQITKFFCVKNIRSQNQDIQHMKRVIPDIYFIILFSAFSLHMNSLSAQSAIMNVDARNTISLNGTWQAIIDPTGIGDWRQVWLEKKPVKKTDFIEYSFEGGPSLQVPGDFNTQMPELTFEECTLWYKKTFNYKKNPDKRLFLHFGAVNYMADVFLNGKKLGSHEGGFTPFQFELTDVVNEGQNAIIVKVNNQRLKDGLPGPGYDWFNYGGITRDVNLVEVSKSFIEEYFIQLKKNSFKEVSGWIRLNGNKSSENIRIRIPELKVDYQSKSNNEGIATVSFSAAFQLWSPQNPKLYQVIIQSETDTITDFIGFRSIEVKGTGILLNGKPIFLKGVNIHEERPLKAARANSVDDARILLSWAKELGCNLVRLAHYPHNEHMVKMAEKMGLMVWEEIPVYQQIAFASLGVPQKMDRMMTEMISRDRNRCSVIIWSLSNETNSSAPNRDKALIDLSKRCRLQDSTRLITSVINDQGYENNTLHVWDTLYKYFDIMSVNEYLGWYVPWQGKPSDVKWELPYQKPVFISEFGGEAKYGSNFGPKDEANSWSEEYQEQIYKDQVSLFGVTPNLSGVCAWILVDYRSPTRMHPVYQQGYNRKGLLSEKGEKKKAWYILKQFYETKY